jgi:hypothetical protein
MSMLFVWKSLLRLLDTPWHKVPSYYIDPIINISNEMINLNLCTLDCCTSSSFFKILSISHRRICTYTCYKPQLPLLSNYRVRCVTCHLNVNILHPSEIAPCMSSRYLVHNTQLRIPDLCPYLSVCRCCFKKSLNMSEAHLCGLMYGEYVGVNTYSIPCICKYRDITTSPLLWCVAQLFTEWVAS